jgi:hypothetical protein
LPKLNPNPTKTIGHYKNAYAFVEKTKPLESKNEIKEEEKVGNHE